MGYKGELVQIISIDCWHPGDNVGEPTRAKYLLCIIYIILEALFISLSFPKAI